MADFVAEFSYSEPGSLPQVWQLQVERQGTWELQVDGAKNRRGAGAGLVLTSPTGEILRTAIKLDFEATNNEAEYEALILGLIAARREGAASISVFSDSQLIVNQVSGEYGARNSRMLAYLEKAMDLLSGFADYTVKQIPRDQNEIADALATLASSSASG